MSNPPRIGVFPSGLWRKASKGLDLSSMCVLAYLWTCQHRKIEGLFELPLGYVASDLNITIEVAEEKMKLLEAKGYIAYEDDGVLIMGYMSVQNKLQGKIPVDTVKGIIKNINELEPSGRLLKLWADEARNIPKLWEALSENGLKLDEVSLQQGSEYILSTYSVHTEYVPSGIGSGIGIGSGSGSGSEKKGQSGDWRPLASDFSLIQQHNEKQVNTLLEEGKISEELASRAKRFIPYTTKPLSKDRWREEIEGLTYIPASSEYDHFGYNVELDELDRLIDAFLNVDYGEGSDHSICLFNDANVKQHLAYRCGVT